MGHFYSRILAMELLCKKYNNYVTTVSLSPSDEFSWELKYPSAKNYNQILNSASYKLKFKTSLEGFGGCKLQKWYLKKQTTQNHKYPNFFH